MSELQNRCEETNKCNLIDQAQIALTLPSWMAGLSAPNNSSAVTLLNAAKPSIGRYYKNSVPLEIKNADNDRRDVVRVKMVSTSLLSPFSSIRFSAYTEKIYHKLLIIVMTISYRLNRGSTYYE